VARTDAASNIGATPVTIVLEILFPMFRLQKPVLAGITASVRTQLLYRATPTRLERRAAIGGRKPIDGYKEAFARRPTM
jgi:hypothetical protein